MKKKSALFKDKDGRLFEATIYDIKYRKSLFCGCNEECHNKCEKSLVFEGIEIDRDTVGQTMYIKDVTLEESNRLIQKLFETDKVDLSEYNYYTFNEYISYCSAYDNCPNRKIQESNLECYDDSPNDKGLRGFFNKFKRNKCNLS